MEHRGVPGPAGRARPPRARQHGRRGPVRHPSHGSCPTRTNVAVSMRRCARTVPRKRPESHQTRLENRSTTSRPTGPGSEATGTSCRASWTCGQTTRDAGRRRGGMRRTRRQHPPRRQPAAEPGAAGGNGRGDRPGSRGRAELSADAQAIEQENKHGGWLEGFDHRLKGEDRLEEKVAEKLEAAGKTAVEVLGRSRRHSLYVLLSARELHQGLLRHQGTVRKPRP